MINMQGADGRDILTTHGPVLVRSYDLNYLLL